MLYLENSLPVLPSEVTTRGPNWGLPANTCASNCLAASVFAVHVAPVLDLPEGMDLDQRATSSEPSSLPADGNVPN